MFGRLLLGVFKLQVSPAMLGDRLFQMYLNDFPQLERGVIEGLAGSYTQEQHRRIQGEVRSLAVFALEAAVRKNVKPRFQEQVLEDLKLLYLDTPHVAEYRSSADVGVTFMTRCGFERNAYICDVGTMIFKTVRNLITNFIKQVRIVDEHGT